MCAAVTSRGGGLRPRLRSRPRARASRSAPAPSVSLSLSLSLSTSVYPWQPDRTLTRHAASLAREVYRVWSARVGPLTRPLPADRVQGLLNEMQLYPSQAQVYEMLKCAQDCSDRSSSAYLTFGEFCLFATELKRNYHKGIPRSSHLARRLERDGKDRKKKNRKMSKCDLSLEGEGSKHEVFLGGSCNPTTWRQDIAIPLLNSLGVSYYNPQVEEWSMELVEKEHEAKASAAVLLYVIDNQTRNVVGMIEAASYAGSQRTLVLVQSSSLYQPGHTINGEQISHQEYIELRNSLLVLKELAERQGIPVFNNISLAVKSTAKMLRDNINMQDLVMADLKQPVTNSHTHVTEKLIKLKEAFSNRDTTGSGHISLADVCMAYRLMTNRKLSVSELRSLISSPTDCKVNPIQVNFEEFCAIIAELKTADSHNNNNNGSSEKWVTCSSPGLTRSVSVDNSRLRDVFLAGDLSDYSWTHQVAIPCLRRHSLTYYTLSEGGEKEEEIPSLLTTIDNSFVQLFVITNQSRSLAVMTMAGNYIGLGCNVILCLQNITEDQVLNHEKLSKQAVNDYNRGRVYLKDLARRDNVPIFDTVEDAVKCAVDKCLCR